MKKPTVTCKMLDADRVRISISFDVGTYVNSIHRYHSIGSDLSEPDRLFALRVKQQIEYDIEKWKWELGRTKNIEATLEELLPSFAKLEK